MQLSGRDHHYRPRPEEQGERGHEQPVETFRGPGQLSLRPGTQRSVSPTVSQAAHRQPHVGQFLAYVCDGRHPPVTAPATGQHDGVQFPIDVCKLDQGSVGQCGKEVG